MPKNSDSKLISTAYLYHLGYNAVLSSEMVGSKVLVIGLGLLGLTNCFLMAKLAGANVTAISTINRPMMSQLIMELLRHIQERKY